MTTRPFSDAGTRYTLGHDAAELARLEHQSGVWAHFTERFLREAGVGPGMRVLDVGCGPGDVAILAARLVGPDGYVLGVDRAAAATEVATRRAARLGLRHVEFRTGLAESLREAVGPTPAPFDAVVGRLILEHVPHPVTVLREGAALVRPGGLVAFLEYDFTTPPTAWPPVALFTRAYERVVAALAAAGVETAIGCKLRRHFLDAGLPAPVVTVSARIDGAAATPAYHMLAEASRTLLPVMERAGIATAAEVDPDTLEARLREAVTKVDASVRAPDLAGAWCTLSAA